MVWLWYMIPGLAGLLFLAIFWGGYIGFTKTLRRQKQVKVKLQEPDPQQALAEEIRQAGVNYFFALRPEEVEIQSRDGLTLRGYFAPAAKPTNKMVVFSHGYRATGEGPGEFGPFVKFYHEVLGWHILLPDQRAHGRSDGKYIAFSAREWEDMFDWIQAFQSRCGDDPWVVQHGISMGAATVLNCNIHTPPACVKCIVEDCGFTNGYEMIVLSGKRDLKLKFQPLYWSMAFWYSVFTGRSLKKDTDLYGRIADMKTPTLFIHGADDPFVPTEMGHRLYNAAQMEKDCLFVPGATHAMSYKIDKAAYEAKLLEWYGNHMQPSAVPQLH